MDLQTLESLIRYPIQMQSNQSLTFVRCDGSSIHRRVRSNTPCGQVIYYDGLISVAIGGFIRVAPPWRWLIVGDSQLRQGEYDYSY